MPVIATNLASLRAQRNLRAHQLEQQAAVQRLSSGQRINTARDDAAGIAVATRMSTQLGGLTVAIRNANDALSVSQVAEGAVGEMVRNLNRAHDLAVQAASYGASGARGASATGAATGSGISASHGVSANAIPVNAGGAPVAQTVTVAGTTYALGTFAPSATALANAVNAAAIPGLSASAVPGAGTAQGVTATSIGNNSGTAEIRINGVNISVAGVAGDPAGNVARALAAINAVAGTTGVTATLVTTAGGSRLDLARSGGGTFELRYRSLSYASSKLSDFGLGPVGAANNTDYTLGGDGISFDYAAPAGITSGTLEFSASTGMSPNVFEIAQTSSGASVAGSLAAGGDAGGAHPLQVELSEILAELGRIVDQTRYNGARLLDGSGAGRFQVGAHVDEGLDLSMPTLAPTALGTATSFAAVSALDDAALARRIARAERTALGSDATLAGVALGAALPAGTLSADRIAAVNASTAVSGVSAFAVGNGLVGSDFASAGTAAGVLDGLAAGALTVNGVAIGAVAGGANQSEVAANLVAAINALSARHGLVATRLENPAGTDPTRSAIVLTSRAGGAIALEARSAVDAGIGSFFNPGASTVGAGRNGAVVLNAAPDQLAVKFDSAATGAAITGVEAAEAALGRASLDTQSLATPGAATLSMLVFAQALDALNATRATLGARMNRVEALIRSQQNVHENVSAARSRVLDADYAVETARLTRAQILQQAGAAMVAQANQQPAGVLALLGR